jgi:AraC family transcriptional regulator
MMSVRHWPGLRSEYAWLTPGDRVTVTGAGQIGIAFTGHRDLVYATGGRSHRVDHPPGATIVSGSDPIAWLRVREPTEALEIYPDPALVAATAHAWSSRPVQVDQRLGHRDGVVLGIASVLRRAHVAGAAVSDVAAGELAHRLAGHLLQRYAGVRAPRAGAGRLDAATVDRITDLVEARLDGTLTLDELAAVARLSPFHFSRAFRASTGLAPYAFVTARRMNRARLLICTSGHTVEQVAALVGYANISHFRRTFRRHHGLAPSRLRDERPQEST